MSWNRLVRKFLFFNFQRANQLCSPYFEKIIDSFPGNLYWKDQNGIYLGCNQNMVKVSGLQSKADIIGKSDIELWPEYAEQIKENDLYILTTGEISEQEEQVNECVYLSTKMPLYDDNNAIVGIIGSSTDITYLKKVESDLIKSNSIKTEFLQNMRHDIRTPMTGIIGCAKLVKNVKNQPTKVEEYADMLINSSEELLNFLTEVLDSVRLNSGEIPILNKKFDLRKILERIINLNQPKAKDKNLDLKLEHDNLIPKYLIGDPRRLYRVALELVTNALKYTHAGHIKVSTKLAKQEQHNLVIKLEIEDTGIGIPSDKQQDIFTRFTRLTASFQGIYQGSGLGLALVKEFLKDLEAEIYVASEINQGSTFTCVIPLKEALLSEEFGIDANTEDYHSNVIVLPGCSNNLSNIDSSFQSSRRILLVEDHHITARINKEILLDLGYQGDIASDGSSAIALVEQNDYGIIFMDLGLPDMTGYEITEIIRANEKNKSIPIIGLTAHANSEDKQRCFAVGMNAVFVKPLMKEKIENLCNIFISTQPNLQKKPYEKNREESNLFVLKGEIIDLKLNIQLANGNKDLANHFLAVLVDSFPVELEKISLAFKSNDLETVKSILHKLRGGL